MKAARIQRFGPPTVIGIENLPRPEPGAGELLVRVEAADVGHWDALIRVWFVITHIGLGLPGVLLFHKISLAAASRIAWAAGAIGAALAVTITVAQLGVHGAS